MCCPNIREPNELVGSDRSFLGDQGCHSLLGFLVRHYVRVVHDLQGCQLGRVRRCHHLCQILQVGRVVQVVRDVQVLQVGRVVELVQVEEFQVLQVVPCFQVVLVVQGIREDPQVLILLVFRRFQGSHCLRVVHRCLVGRVVQKDQEMEYMDIEVVQATTRLLFERQYQDRQVDHRYQLDLDYHLCLDYPLVHLVLVDKCNIVHQLDE